MRDALIIPTFGFITRDQTLPGGQGTRSRVAVAQQLIRDGVVARNCIVPFPQRTMPHGREREKIGNVSLGRNVERYVRNLPEFGDALVSSAPLSSGTYEDTITSFNIIACENRRADDGPVHVHFVSDWSQLGRLWIIWQLAIKSKREYNGWTASFHLVPGFRKVGEIARHEPPAYLKCFVLSLLGRLGV